MPPEVEFDFSGMPEAFAKIAEHVMIQQVSRCPVCKNQYTEWVKPRAAGRIIACNNCRNKSIEVKNEI